MDFSAVCCVESAVCGNAHGASVERIRNENRRRYLIAKAAFGDAKRSGRRFNQECNAVLECGLGKRECFCFKLFRCEFPDAARFCPGSLRCVNRSNEQDDRNRAFLGVIY